MKTKKLNAFFFIFLLFPSISFSQETKDYLQEVFFEKNSSKILLAAHRAAHNLAPENSLLSVQNAIKEGIDIIEIDIRTSKDGVPMLMHDGTIDRTTNGTGKLEDYTFEELKALRLKNKDGSLSDSKIPALREVLAICKGKILIDLDLKLTNIEPVIDEVQKAGMQTHAFFFDSDYRVLKKIKKIDPALYLMPRTYSEKHVKKAIRLFDPQIIHIDPSFYSAALMSDLQARKIRVWINAFGEVDNSLSSGESDVLLDFLEKGANVLQTDQPELMLKELKAVGLHN